MKITIDNLLAEFPKHEARMPKPLRDAYPDIAVNLDLYDKDSEIADVIDKFIDKCNAALDAGGTDKEKPKTKSEPGPKREPSPKKEKPPKAKREPKPKREPAPKKAKPKPENEVTELPSEVVFIKATAAGPAR